MFSDRLKYLRKQLGLTQRQLGGIIGITGSAVHRLENGSNRPAEHTIVGICREFGIRREWLEEGRGDMYSDAHMQSGETQRLLETYECSSPIFRAFVSIYNSLSECDRATIDRIVLLYVEKLRNMIETQHDTGYDLRQFMHEDASADGGKLAADDVFGSDADDAEDDEQHSS